jgi:1-deoxy-D-xylulose-5-phosphate reductoisomerase
LTHPHRRADDGTRTFDPVAVSSLTFEPVAAERFPAFALGVEAGRRGGTAPAAFNAANEVAVAGFLDGAIPFTGIAEVIARALDAHEITPADSLESVLAADRRARDHAVAALRKTC